jgi:hypothetical protein
VFDHAGNAYVAYRDGTLKSDSSGTSDSNVFHFFINKFNSNGDLIDTFELPDAISGTQNLGSRIHESVWIDLASDQRTLYYTTATGENIKRYDTLRNIALPDFASCLTGVYPSDIRILADDSGGALVVDGARLASSGFIGGVHTSAIAEPSRILRIDKTGAIAQVYDAPGKDTWTSISLVPDGKSFWAADDRTANVVRFDIASGNMLGSFDSGLERHSITGLSIKGEQTAATSRASGTFVINNTNTAAMGGPCQAAPVVQDITTTTTNNTSTNITLTGTDTDNYEYLTFSILNNTESGTLGQINQINNTAANVTYTPEFDFRNGTDSFTYSANDGILDSSNNATVTIQVSETNGTSPEDNLPPIANAGSDQRVNESAVNVVLNGSGSNDPDNDSIVSYLWTQTAGPAVTLTEANTAVPTFVAPSVNTETILTFALKVTDSRGATSATADTVNVLVKNVNQAPIASDLHLTTNQDTSADGIELRGSDPDGASAADGNPLTYSIVQQPKNGTLSLPLTTITFIGSENMSGSQEVPPLDSSRTDANGTAMLSYDDSSNMLRYNITYNGLSSQEVGAHIHIGATGNDGPIVFPLSLGTTKTGEVGPLTEQQRQDLFNGNMYVNIHSSQYPDGEIRGQLKYNGTTIATTSYTPNSGFSGIDTFTYKVSDGDLESNPVGIVTITVNSVNKPPVAVG